MVPWHWTCLNLSVVGRHKTRVLELFIKISDNLQHLAENHDNLRIHNRDGTYPSSLFILTWFKINYIAIEKQSTMVDTGIHKIHLFFNKHKSKMVDT